MSSGNSNSPGGGYFNDLSRQPTGDRNSNHDGDDGPDSIPRPKRIACVVCRKRKLRCDGSKPSCGTCSRLGHECAYDEVRRKSGPKRGYVKALEARLAQVETLLKTQDPPEQNGNSSSTAYPNVNQSTLHNRPDYHRSSSGMPHGMHQGDGFSGLPQAGDSYHDTTRGQSMSNILAANGMNLSIDANLGSNEEFSWEMISLGLDEPLPTQDVIDDLHQIYFEKMHPFVPIVHRPRYLAAMNLAPMARPAVCLRYAIWCLASSVSEKYSNLQEHFYLLARKYAMADEMRGMGEGTITTGHAQSWILICTHEFRQMYFPRAWLSTGRAVRLAQMMGMHRLDGVGLDVKQCLPPPRDWTEREERRRTFWMAFCGDRYSSIGTGWPLNVDENDILTKLPATEEAFDKSRPARTLSLPEALSPSGASEISPLAGVVLMACLFGRNLTHLHRPDPEDHDDDLNGAFWKRHRHLDNILLNTSLALPEHLKLPLGLSDPNIIFLNMNIHSSTICLHQAAIFKAEKNRLPATVSAESKVRCVSAAAEIASTMRMISHQDLGTMHPFLSFCLYVAARVFIQYHKSRPDDQQVLTSLQFILTAMHALKRKNPLTESFLMQLELDLEGTKLDTPQATYSSKYNCKGVAEVPINSDAVKCSPLITIQQTQSAGQEIWPTEPLYANDSPTSTHNSDSGSKIAQVSSGESYQNLPNRMKPSASSLNAQDPRRGAYGMQRHPPAIIPGETQAILRSNDSNRRWETSEGDMDISPDNNGGRHSSTSTSDHTTPNSSHNASSSHTSFTPPNLDDSQTYPPTQNRGDLASNDVDNPTSTFFNMPNYQDLANGDMFPSTPSKDDNAFAMPPGWDFGLGGGTGMTPTATGMTPVSGQVWSEMLEGMGWDASSMGEARRRDGAY
ncbi:MAG: hypothetical protein M1836_005599 [Candelina mexicana]|nr:MAG: hypothetical protein M1836_005599 [Candelina mexicana]